MADEPNEEEFIAHIAEVAVALADTLEKFHYTDLVAIAALLRCAAMLSAHNPLGSLRLVAQFAIECNSAEEFVRDKTKKQVEEILHLMEIHPSSLEEM